MPKSSPKQKPSDISPDQGLLRKKKNADAQAAFRARRQNYISTLEETVTSLESVVVQLQDSCRETRNQNLDLRQENSRLRYENREREKYWKAFLQARKLTHTHGDPTLISSPFSAPSTAHHSSSSSLLPPPDSYLSYRSSPQTYDNVGSTNFVDQHTPSVTFTNHDDVDGSSLPHPDRPGKYPTYPYSIQDSPRDPRWQLPTPLSQPTPQSQSPSYLESPSLTAPPYPTRFPTNDRKLALDVVLSSAPYVFPTASRYQESIPNSRSMSPSTSASSATSLPLTSSYQLPFQDPSTAQDHADFEYRGHSLPHCADVMLHGGIADISLASQYSDSARYPSRFTRTSDDNQDHLSMLPENDTVSQHQDSATRLRANRRNMAHPYRRSQSPGPTPLSSTVAVIKAQAFGALRRTRAKSKKTTDSAARVAQDVLEARGIGVGTPSSGKRSRLYEEEDVGKP